MAEKIVIASLDIDMGALLKSTTELKAEIDRLKEAQKQLTKEGETASEQYVQNVADLKTLNSAYNANVKAISDSTTAQADQANQSKLVALALNSEAQSIKEAREQNSLLNRLRNETNVTTVEGKAQLDALNKKLDENNAFIKENADQYLQQKINIGNYKDSIKEAFNEMNIFNGGFSAFIARSQEAGGVMPLLSNGLKGITTGIMGMIRASLAFIATPIGAVIAAIGLVLSGLISYLKSTQEGMDRITAVTRPLQAIFESLIGVLQNVGKYLFEAFSNPKKTLTELYEFVKQNLINRFTAFAEILEGIIELDFKKVTDGVLQAGTGVEGMTDKIKNASKETGKFLDDAIKKGQEVDKITKQIEEAEISLNKEREIGNTKIKELDRITKDTSANFAERLKANEEQNRIASETAKKEQEILNLKIQKLKIEQTYNDTTREGYKELADLEAELERSKQRQIDEELKGVRVIAQARKDEQARIKEAQNKAIEAEIAKSKQEIDLFIAQQGFKKKSTEEEYNFNKQIYDKELKDLELRYSKGKVSKLEYETEKLNLATEFSKSNADLLIAEGERELEIIKNNAKLSIDARLEAELNYQDLRLEQGIINEQQYQDAITQIQNDYEKMRQDKKLEDEALERERKAIDLENKRANDQLTFEQDVELQREQNAIKLEEELLNAEKSGADQQLIKDKYAQLDQRLTQSVEDFKIASLSNTFGKISALFGQQSKIGKAFALYQAGIDGYQSVMKAFNSQFIPGDPSSLPRAIGAGAFAGAFAVKQIAGIAGAKFEKGGIQEIGGKRHSAGGTKFYGEDGTTFEAEAGEGIGILNRSAFSTFMDFNNRFGSGSSASGFFQGGGIITQGVRTESANLDAVVEAIANIPPPVVAVEEIQSVGNRFVQVQQNANL